MYTLMGCKVFGRCWEGDGADYHWSKDHEL